MEFIILLNTSKVSDYRLYLINLLNIYNELMESRWTQPVILKKMPAAEKLCVGPVAAALR